MFLCLGEANMYPTLITKFTLTRYWHGYKYGIKISFHPNGSEKQAISVRKNVSLKLIFMFCTHKDYL